jgi:DNA-binding MarR family transcriptional regulator
MRLEDELKQQKKFANEFEKLAVNILFTASWVEARHIQRYKPYGISPQQYNVLRILRGSSPKPMMLGDIASRMIDKNSNATRLVEKLRLKSLVKRSICESNRRQVDITITDKGMELLAVIDREVDTWANNMKGVTEADAQHINDILDNMRQ